MRIPTPKQVLNKCNKKMGAKLTPLDDLIVNCQPYDYYPVEAERFRTHVQKLVDYYEVRILPTTIKFGTVTYVRQRKAK